jgi:hypothetical protein
VTTDSAHAAAVVDEITSDGYQYQPGSHVPSEIWRAAASVMKCSST